MLALLSFIKGVPLLVWPLLAALAWGGWGHHQANAARLTLATEQRDHAQAVTNAVQAAVKESAEITARQKEKIDAKALELANAQAGLVASDGAYRRLLELTRRASGHPATGDPAPAGPSPTADNLAGTLAACVEEYRSLGQVAIDAVGRGQQCEGWADALTNNQPQKETK